MNTFEIPTSREAYNFALALAWIDNNRTIEEYKRRQIPMPVSYMRYVLETAREFIATLRVEYGDTEDLSEAMAHLNAALVAMPQAAYEAADGGLLEVRK